MEAGGLAQESEVSAVESLVQELTPTSVVLSFVPLRVRAGRLEVQVCPGDGGWKLPSGAPDPRADLEEEAERLGAAMLALPGEPVQLGAFGRPVDGVNVVFTYLVRPAGPGQPTPQGALPGGSWWDVRGVRPAADTESVLHQALARVSYEVEHGQAGFLLVGHEFTVSELRRVHESVRGVSLDPSNFRKRVSRWVDEGLVVELDRMRPTATRPARLYRLA